MQTLSSKDPAEYVPVSFDFSALVSSITTVTSITVTVETGTDASPSTLKEGSPTTSGAVVTQLIKGGVAGVVYIIRADIVSGSEKYALPVRLPVIDAKDA